MTIRFPLDPAAAAAFAESAVELAPAAPAAPSAAFADATFAFPSGGQDIRLVVGPGFDLIAPKARKGIPGQTYH